MITRKAVAAFPPGPIADAAAALPGREGSAVRAAADALRREPLAAPWAALATVLGLAAPPPSCDDARMPSAVAPGPALHDRGACAAMAMLAVRALRRRVLAAAALPAEPDWTEAAFRAREAGLLSARRHGLARDGPGWRHVADLRGMLPTLADTERPAAALAARLLGNEEARVWWGLHEHELRAALEGHDPDTAAVPDQPDDVRAAVEQARHALAERLGVSPQRVLIMVAL